MFQIIRHVAPVACFFALILVLSLGLPVTGLAATLPLVEASGSSDPSAIQDLPLSESKSLSHQSLLLQ